jgi:hypothetical protein
MVSVRAAVIELLCASGEEGTNGECGDILDDYPADFR